MKRKVGIISTLCGVFANLGLSILKFFIAIATNSVIIFYDAINNLLDSFTSITGALGFSIKDKKPTKQFPYGFGRIEALISFVISFVTIIFASIFMYHSIERIVYPLPVYFGWIYFWLLCLTTIIKIVMGISYYLLYRKSKSEILLSLTQDNILDSIISGSTVLCYGLTLVNNTIIDAIFALVFGLIMFIFAIINSTKQVKSILGSSNNIDINKIKEELINKDIFENIEIIRMSDYGKDSIELFILGQLNKNKENELIEYSNNLKIKIYMIEDNLYENQNEERS